MKDTLEDIKPLLIKIFEYLYVQQYNVPGYRINLKANDKLIDNFFKILEKHDYPFVSIGHDFLTRFFLFQMEYWKEKEIIKKPVLSWFIGKKAIERFESIEDWTVKNYWIGQNTQHLINYDQDKGSNDYENSHRKKFHNTNKGLLYCLENTSLYVKSVTCITCKFKAQCKGLLKENYPLLYKKRIKCIE